MSDDRRAQADARLDAALADADRRDPRKYYRPVLRQLKTRDPAAFDAAVAYFDETLVPGCLNGDPLAAWLDYGIRIAEALGSGRTVDIDGTGRAHVADDPAAAAGLLLFVPDATGAPVLVLRHPADATAAQRATVELLAEGRVVASEYG
jgi:hypothetical protein